MTSRLLSPLPAATQVIQRIVTITVPPPGTGATGVGSGSHHPESADKGRLLPLKITAVGGSTDPTLLVLLLGAADELVGLGNVRCWPG